VSANNARRWYLIAARSVLAGVGLGAVVLIGLLADVYLHKKYERTALVNVWGYRGPVIGNKAPGEIRVVVLGGSTAFGFGPDWTGSMPYLLEQRLNAPGRARFSVVNIAFNNEGAFAMRFGLEDYLWLDYDIAILYEGYNDLLDAPNYEVFRRRSGVFRLTGYLPILPIVLNEKAMLLLYGGVGAGYDNQQTTFRPGVVNRTTATALDAAAATARSLEDQIGRLTKNTAAAMSVSATADCPARWQHYCGAMFDAISFARAHDKGVLVGTQPFLSDSHVEQQQALVSFLQGRFGRDSRVAHVNLGNAIDVAARKDVVFDGSHLTAEGNDIIARHFTQPVIEMTAQLRAAR
jgi:hypothetical protein